MSPSADLRPRTGVVEVANVDDNITAISFVALGTSVPDRSGFAFAPALHRCFASRGEGGVEVLVRADPVGGDG